MKKTIVILLMIFSVLACKSDKNKDQAKDKIEKKLRISKTILLPKYPLWILKNISLTNKNSKFNSHDIFELKRTTTDNNSYVFINKISVISGENYRASVLVKKGNIGSLFGMRIMGDYPSRVDAIFDLDKGKKIEVIGTGGFSGDRASIEHLEDDWYKCSIEAKVNSDEAKIILGATSHDSKVITWEAKTNEECEILILPSSLIFEEFKTNFKQ